MKFPETDAQGRKLRRTYQFTLSGTNHKHDGIVPEQILNQSMVGDSVTLVWEKGNKYDPGAVKVLWNGKYIGCKNETTKNLQGEKCQHFPPCKFFVSARLFSAISQASWCAKIVSRVSPSWVKTAAITGRSSFRQGKFSDISYDRKVRR